MLHITINQSDGTPMYLQLVRQIKHMIATGRLAPDTELPPVRVLAKQLVVNPNTVVRAYLELERAGLIYKRRGAGTYVSDQGTPYAKAEITRILTEQADALIVESRTLGWDFAQLQNLMEQRHNALAQSKKEQT